jgi:solute:Na+ symporter, SSS family
LYSVLVFFTILALGSAGLFNKYIPDSVISFIFLKNNNALQDADQKKNTDYFLSARNSAGSGAIALSYFAAGMGAWVSATGGCFSFLLD